MLKHLPNAMTCGNLLCGCIGILFATSGDLTTAAWLIVLAGVLDFGDGLVARMVGASGPFGKELDSLADVVTFGVLPSFILFGLLNPTFLGQSSNVPVEQVRSVAGQLGYTSGRIAGWLTLLFPFAIAVCGALRLARFNIDTRQTDQFLGVPIPANALAVASLPLMMTMPAHLPGTALVPFFTSTAFLAGYIVVMSGLMVSELPLMAFKFKSYGWRENKLKYGFLLTAVGLLLLLQFAAIPLVILLYIVLSLLKKA